MYPFQTQVPLVWEEVDVTPVRGMDGKTQIPQAAIQSVNENKIGLKGIIYMALECFKSLAHTIGKFYFYLPLTYIDRNFFWMTLKTVLNLLLTVDYHYYYIITNSLLQGP